MFRLPSPAMIVACVALVVALGGTGYAVTALPRNSVGPNQIRTGAVRSSDVRDRSLLAKDFAANQLPRGAPGAQGKAGVRGATGARGPQGPKGDRGEPGALGVAGGALAGSYPNPAIAGGAVGAAELAPGAVGPAHLASVPAAQVQALTSQALADQVEEVVDVGDEVFDTADMFGPAFPNQLRAPRPGLYRAEGTAVWAADLGGQRRLTLEDGVGGIFATDHRGAVGVGPTAQTVSTLVELGAGMNVVLVGKAQDTTGAADITLSGARLSLVYLGAVG